MKKNESKNEKREIDVTAQFATQPVSKPARRLSKIMAHFKTGWLEGFETGWVDTNAVVTGQLIR